MNTRGFKFWEPHPESENKKITWPSPLGGTVFDGKICELATAIAKHLDSLKSERSNEVKLVMVYETNGYLSPVDYESQQKAA